MRDLRAQTYYELLEVEPTATQEEILKAYNRARTTYGNNNPALYSLFSKEEARDLLRLIDEAYLILSNQFKRRQYDQTQSNASPPETFLSAPPSATQTATVHSIGENAIPDAILTDFEPEPRSSQPMSPAKVEIFTPPPIEKYSDMKSTRFGTYKFDQKYEDEISNTEHFPGKILQNIRLYKNISIDQISNSSKVSRPYLIAVERDDYKSLPATVYVRGFIVQFAKILGLPTDKVANSYIAILKAGRKE